TGLFDGRVEKMHILRHSLGILNGQSALLLENDVIVALSRNGLSCQTGIPVHSQGRPAPADQFVLDLNILFRRHGGKPPGQIITLCKAVADKENLDGGQGACLDGFYLLNDWQFCESLSASIITFPVAPWRVSHRRASTR